MHVCSPYACGLVETRRGQLIPLNLELQAILSATRMLGLELKSFVTVVHTLSHGVPLSRPLVSFSVCLSQTGKPSYPTDEPASHYVAEDGFEL